MSAVAPQPCKRTTGRPLRPTRRTPRAPRPGTARFARGPPAAVQSEPSMGTIGRKRLVEDGWLVCPAWRRSLLICHLECSTGGDVATRWFGKPWAPLCQLGVFRWEVSADLCKGSTAGRTKIGQDSAISYHWLRWPRGAAGRLDTSARSR